MFCPSLIQEGFVDPKGLDVGLKCHSLVHVQEDHRNLQHRFVSSDGKDH